MTAKNTPNESNGNLGTVNPSEREQSKEPSGQSAAAEIGYGNPADAEPGAASNSNNSRGTLIVALFLTGFGIFWIISAIRIPNLTRVGTLGPGFLPFWAGVTLTVISVLLCVHTLRERRRATGSFEEDQGLVRGWQWRVFATFSALFIYIILLPHVHFFINTFFISSAGLALTGEKLKLRLLLVAGVISGALFAIFVFWLQIPLPGSRLGI